MKRLFAAVACAALSCAALSSCAAYAQMPITVTPTDCSASIGTSASQVLAASQARKGFLLQNVSSNNIGISFTSNSPSIGSAQTFTLAPGASVSSTATGTPGSALYAIASGASSELACQWN